MREVILTARHFICQQTRRRGRCNCEKPRDQQGATFGVWDDRV